MTLRPRGLNIVLMALVLSPLWAAGLWDIWRFMELAVGSGLLGLALVIWLYGIASVRVVAGDKYVEMRRLFWRVWRVEVSHSTIREGYGGDLPLLPAFILQQGNRGPKGYLVKYLFAPARLEAFLDFLVQHGASRE